MKKIDRDTLLFHLGFGIAAWLVLAVLPWGSLGIRLCALVLGYNIALPLAGFLAKHRSWINLWRFVFPLSILQIFPDWFLAEVPGSIVFPDTGSPYIGPIPIFMAGMWAIPFFLIVYAGQWARRKYPKGTVYLIVAIVSLLIFVGSEALLWSLPVWQAVGVKMIGHVALYVIVPELLLGISTYLAFRQAGDRSLLARLGAAFSVMLLYTGALGFFYLLVESI